MMASVILSSCSAAGVADGGFGTVHHLANGNKDLLKGRLEACAGVGVSVSQYSGLAAPWLVELHAHAPVAAGQRAARVRDGVPTVLRARGATANPF